MYARGTRTTAGVGTRLIAVALLIWFIIGTIAAAQRHYFDSGGANCAHAGTIAVTILASPLNYAGANPKVSDCQVPQPSR